MDKVNYTFLLYLCIILLGYLLKRIRVLTREDGQSLSRIIINITLPALVIHVISKIDIDPSLALLPFLCFVYNGIISLVTTGFFKRSLPGIRGVEMMGVIGFNIGLFAYPFVDGIWGKPGLVHIAMFDLGNAFVIFGIAYVLGFIFSPQRKETNEKVDFKRIARLLLTSIPFLGYVAAILINVTGARIPGFIDEILKRLGQANMVLVLLVLGVFLNFQFSREQLTSILKVVGVRYIIGLGTGITLFYLLPFSHLYRAIVIIALILPVGLAIIPFSVEFAYDQKLAGTFANLTIIISFFLMWFLVFVFNLA